MRTVWRTVFATTLLACGQLLALDGDDGDDVAGTPDAGGTDAGADADLDSTVHVTSPGCRVGEPFTNITPVSELNTAAGETGARLSADGLEVILTRTEANVGRLYRATRATTTEPFAALALLDLGASEKRHGVLSGDGRTLYFATESFDKKIGWSRRAGAGEPFTAEQELVLAVGGQHFEPFVSPDERILYFVADLTGNENRIYVARRDAPTEPFGLPVDVAELNAFSGDKAVPVFTADELTVYLAATAPGRGDSDIFVSTRALRTDPWSAPVPVAELSSDPANDRPSWVSPDGCTMYFVSDRTAGRAFDVWRAEKPR